eukprot:CAMPEP_0194536640 /NCGR_PEP_ID=MMETSP0253-20130528/75642_1 /TAXON_ID=2966 /ORGANISM="Noctiluca scintillans" /LENGTH=567 /DNA_ID=CAMNT_0039382581 /DNA_START=34 /DNA_END=1733 /DNA_ORIENTATION=-
MAVGCADNPFSVSRDLFWLTEPCRPENAEPGIRIWEKSTAASRHHTAPKIRDVELSLPPAPVQRASSRPTEAFLTHIATKPSVGLVDPLRGDERNLRNYVQQKREVFLLHMALDVKQSETVRLDELARDSEDALMKSQSTLDEDAKRFEDFLQIKIKRAQETMKDAEAHTKQKHDRLQCIKQLKQDISSVQSEIGKLRVVREECARYKAFFANLTPPEWTVAQQQLKVNRKTMRRKEAIESGIRVVLDRFTEEERQLERSDEEDSRRRRGRRKGREEEEKTERVERLARRRRMLKRREEEERRVASGYQEVSSEEEPESFFQEPQQLLDMFTELEEKNLCLIQGLQHTECTLEKNAQKLKEVQGDMGSTVRKLNEAKVELERCIAYERKSGEELRRKINDRAGTEAQERKLTELTLKVQAVYRVAGLSTDHGPDTLQMLSAIESKLEELYNGLEELFQMDSDAIMALEKAKEKNRRDRLREERIKREERRQEDRLKTSLERSQAPVHKKLGKQTMFRSPPRQERRVVKDTSEDEANARDHRVFALYINREQKPCTDPPEDELPTQFL